MNNETQVRENISLICIVALCKAMFFPENTKKEKPETAASAYTLIAQANRISRIVPEANRQYIRKVLKIWYMRK